MTHLNFKTISAELETLCHVQFRRPDRTGTQYVQFSENPAFDQDLQIDEQGYCPTSPVPIYDNRKHVFANVWERSLDQRGNGSPSPDTWTVNWRQWPPDIPDVPVGLKIPVELIPNPELGLMEAVPISSGTRELYESRNGLLNTVQTSSIIVDPPALLFLRSQVGQFYTVKLRLKNVDSIPRRIKVFPPKNPCFQINYGQNRPAIIPGLTIPITVNFRPDSNESVNEILYITVEGDGALTVPLVSATIPPPILEMDEWDCGCSVISTPRTESFEIKNVGSLGRFWFLTEDEFRYEYLAFGNEQKNSTPQIMRDKSQLNTVSTKSFNIYPSCFKLQRNQLIHIRVMFVPKTPGLHYEKLAMMCDNGEVRWIAIKGIGIDIRSKGLVELKGEPFWTAPPVDIQSDANCRYSIDLGDLLPGDGGRVQFTAINQSCIPLYFFWSVRPLQLDVDNEEPMGNISFQKFLEGSLNPVDWEDNTNLWQDGIILDEPNVDVKVSPSQGILRQRQEMGFTLSSPCPEKNLGYYGCVISLFVEQVDDESISIITPFLKELDRNGKNDIPIHFDDLRRTMPSDPGQNDVFEAGDAGHGSGRNTTSTVYIMKHGRHGHDKLAPLKSPHSHHKSKHHHHTNTCGDNSGGHHHTHRKSHETTPQTSGRKSQAGGDLDVNPQNEIETDGGENEEEFDYIKKPDQGLRGSTEPEMNPEFTKVPKPKTWLKNAALLPIAEVEVWLRTVPLNIQFNPPFIIATGESMSQTERTITAYNASAWTVEVNWEDLIEPSGCISCEPLKFSIAPQQTVEFKATILFDRNGKFCKDLKGFITVQKSTMQTPCSIPCSITTTGPFIITLTPIINFGIMRITTEKMKTLAIKNIGNYPAQWTASVNADGLVDEQNHNISPFNRNIEALKLLRVWPTWGILEPHETLGINVYFSGEIPGETAASVKIVVDGIPDSAIYIPICADVQAPYLVLEEGEIKISKEAMLANEVQDTTVTLVNPTGFPINFAWKSCLIGRQSQLVSAQFSPSAGYVPPRGTMDCILTMSANTETSLRNVFALCIVDAMKEPLILKLTSAD